MKPQANNRWKNGGNTHYTKKKQASKQENQFYLNLHEMIQLSKKQDAGKII